MAALPCSKVDMPSGSDVGLGLAQTHDAFAFFPLAAFLEDLDALEALEEQARQARA